MGISTKQVSELLKVSLTGNFQERTIAAKLLSLFLKNKYVLHKASKKLNKSIHAKITLEALKKVAKDPPQTI